MLNNLQNNEFKLYTFNGVDVSNEYNDEFMELFATNDDDRIKDFIAENKLLIITNNNDNEEFEANAKKITQEIDYDQLLSLTPVTVKMYFPGDVSACLYPVDGPIHTKICITVKFYTYANVHPVTGGISWTDRPYIALAGYGWDDIHGGTLTNGLGGATRTISGINVTYRNSWSTPVLRWSGYSGGHWYYDIRLTYPRMYHNYSFVEFTPLRWYDGGGIVSSS